MFKALQPDAIGIRSSMGECLQLAKNAGFEGLNLPINEADKLAQANSVDYVKDLWGASGLKMAGWGLPVNWRDNNAEFDEDLRNLPRLAQLAADLGCFRSTTWILPSGEIPFKENWDLHVKCLRSAAEILKEYGHRFGLEFVAPATRRKDGEFLFLHTMDAVLGLAAAIGTGNVGLLFDVWHWYTSHATFDDVRKLDKDDVVYVHINDAPSGIDRDDQQDLVRCLPGETGVIPVAELLQILRDIGYDGPVVPEPLSEKVYAMESQDAANATARALDKVWGLAGFA
jgi:sugar phosphate isomerase/epimerase